MASRGAYASLVQRDATGPAGPSVNIELVWIRCRRCLICKYQIIKLIPPYSTFPRPHYAPRAGQGEVCSTPLYLPARRETPLARRSRGGPSDLSLFQGPTLRQNVGHPLGVIRSKFPPTRLLMGRRYVTPDFVGVRRPRRVGWPAAFLGPVSESSSAF